MSLTITAPWDRSERSKEENDITTDIGCACRLVGMSGILSEKGVAEFITRVYICAMAGMDEVRHISVQDVRKNIGLRVNVTPLPRPRFYSIVNRYLALRSVLELPSAYANPHSPLKMTVERFA